LLKEKEKEEGEMLAGNPLLNKPRQGTSFNMKRRWGVGQNVGSMVMSSAMQVGRGCDFQESVKRRAEGCKAVYQRYRALRFPPEISPEIYQIIAWPLISYLKP